MLVKKKIKFILALSLLLLGLMRFTSAAVPTTVNYQGRLSDAANIPLSGQYDFRFRLYDDAAKTNLLWGPEEHLDQTVDNGYVSVQLGSIASFEAAGLDFTDQYWLTVQIKENTAGTWDDETDPPVEFSSYSYALNSEKVVSPTGEVNVGETIQGGSALVGAETAFGINTGSGFSGDLLALSNDSTNYLTIDSVGDAYFSNMQKINMENNSVNNLIGLKVTNTNDVDNYAGSILELKGSGPDYTNNVYFGKYGDGFWVPSWAGNGVLATDQDLILGSMGSSDVTNPNADPRILFQIGGGYSTPITTAIMESDGLELLPYDTVAGATSGLRFRELAANGSNYVSLQASDAMASDLNFVLPNSYGSNGEFLTTDGTGNLSWGAALTANSIWDTDSDTGIQVEEIADEDMIRFDIGNSSGTAYPDAMVIDSDGEVGISTNTPDYSLDVAGDIGVDGYIYHNDDSNTYTYFTPDRWQLYTGGRSMIDVQFSDSEITFNEGGTQNDFRVEGGTLENLFFVDGSADKVGLGNNTPNAFLDISSDVADAIRINPYGTLTGNTGNLEFMELLANGSNYVGFKAPDDIVADVAWVLPNADGSNGQVLSTDGSGQLSWETPSGGSATVTSVDLTVASTDGNFTSGTLVGYEAANDICASEYAGSHFCRTDEIISYIASSGASGFTNGTTAWIAEGPPGYTSNSNDCNGWTDNDATKLGAFWEFSTTGGGMGWLTNCGVSKPLACCQ